MKKATKQQTQDVDKFRQLTGTTKQQAQKYLTSAKWNFQTAINKFYDQGGKIEKQKQISQIEQLFKKLSTYNQKDKVFYMDQDNYNDFFLNYLKLDAQDIVYGYILGVCMELPQSSMGKIKKQHFYNLFHYTKASTLKQLIKYIPKLQAQVKDPKCYKNMYMKLYDVFLIGQKTTHDFQYAKVLWQVYLKPIMPLFKQFQIYLQQPKTQKILRVHKDLWRMVYQFAVNVKNLQQYTQEDGWPVFIDQFVQFLRKNKK